MKLTIEAANEHFLQLFLLTMESRQHQHLFRIQVMFQLVQLEPAITVLAGSDCGVNNKITTI